MGKVFRNFLVLQILAGGVWASGPSRVYFFDGFVVHIPGTGINSRVEELGRTLTAVHPDLRFSFMHNSRWDEACKELLELPVEQRPSRLILLGHSFGASGAVAVADCVKGLPVDLLLTFDGVQFPGRVDVDVIPPNVSANYNYFQDQDWFMNPIPYPHLLRGAQDNHRQAGGHEGIFNYKVEIDLWKTGLMIGPHYQVAFDVMDDPRFIPFLDAALK